MILLTWLVTVLGLGFATLLLPGIQAKNTVSFLAAATVLGLMNATLRPILWLLTAPLAMVTFGIFILVINALIIKLSAALVPGYEVKTFGTAFLAAIIMLLTTAVSMVMIALLSGADISIQTFQYSQTL
jgi:putative membrane protein